MTQRRPARDAEISHERFFKLRPYLGMHESTSVLPSLFGGEERPNLPRSLDCLERRIGASTFRARTKALDPHGSPPDSPTPSRRPSSSETAPWPLPTSPPDPSASSEVDGHRPEPAQAVGTATSLVDAADGPLAAIDRVVRAVFRSRSQGRWGGA
jgi:hypothetical protein